MALEEGLRRLGIEGKQARFYLAALELGQAPVREIARKAGISRTNAYDVLAKLLERGLVTQVERAAERRYYIAAGDPSRLLGLLDEQRQTLEGLLPELRSMYSHSAVKPRVRFYEGVEGIRAVLNDTLGCRSRRLLGILSMGDLFNVPGRAEMESYVARRIASGVALKVLRSREKDVGNIWRTSATELRELRYTPPGIVFTMTMYIYDEKVAIISSRRENFGMTIESPEFARTQEQLFMVLWAASAPAV